MLKDENEAGSLTAVTGFCQYLIYSIVSHLCPVCVYIYFYFTNGRISDIRAESWKCMMSHVAWRRPSGSSEIPFGHFTLMDNLQNLG